MMNSLHGENATDVADVIAKENTTKSDKQADEEGDSCRSRRISRLLEKPTHTGKMNQDCREESSVRVAPSQLRIQRQ